MRDGDSNKSAQPQIFTANFSPGMPLGQKVLLTVFFACTAGRDRPIRETHTELAALCGMDLLEYFDHLLELKIAGTITDDRGGQGLRINRRAIKNAKAIDERAALAAKRVRGRQLQ
jgi:hypothetical protein